MARRIATFARLLVVTSVISGCSDPAPTQDAPSVDAAGPEEAPRAGLGRVANVVIPFPRVEGTFSRSTETAGLVALLLEAGLADLAEVRPRIGAAPGPIGSSRALLGEAEAWTGAVTIRSAEPTLRVALTLCDAGGACTEHAEAGPSESPWLITGALLRRAAFTLGRAPPPEFAPVGWDEPVSADAYATLVTGRAAAVFYGALPPPREEAIGDKRRDPLTRATFLDPGIGRAWWLVGRRAAAAGDLDGAVTALARASVTRPESPAFLADDAFALAERGRHEQALALYEALAALLPGDPRFVIPHARAAAPTAPDRAADLLDALPARLQGTPEELAIRVDLDGDRRLSLDQQDALLARWQGVAPEDAVPVRRRVRIAVETARYAQALELAAELGRRGADDEAGRLAVALEAATHPDAGVAGPPLEAPPRTRRHGARTAPGRTGSGAQPQPASP